MNERKRVRGMSNIKTCPKAKCQSMPGGTANDRYLDGYLTRKKKNLEAELKRIGKELHKAGRIVFERKTEPQKRKADAIKAVALGY